MNGERCLTSRKKRFQILALSGGGFRGQYTATILAELERVTRQPLARSFDLIVGTSVGGILALGLALEIPAEKLAELFSHYGGTIFARRFSPFAYWRARYSPQGLELLLKQPDLFGSRVIGECRHRVLVPTINYSTGRPAMLRTPHHPYFRTDHVLRIVDVALAASAAPFYFPRHLINHNQYIDGGLCANAPGLLGVHDAEIFLGQSIQRIHVLAVGTMSSTFTVNPKHNRAGGIRDWGRGSPAHAAQRLLGITISAQESLAQCMLQHRLGDARFTLLDDVLPPDRVDAVALDKTDAAAREVLIGTARERAKHALEIPKLQRLLEHKAAAARFFHGAHASAQRV